ncbi:hypothetical protein BJ165DRAFT_884459 [Panaeolus papilionaceus]|nr:hypothetical protein BJ165DRAFT_884459 [Panaeolus papilionaceus]
MRYVGNKIANFCRMDSYILLECFANRYDDRLSGTTNLFKAVYRDAVIYYIYLLILSTVNMVITVALPLEYQDLLISMTRCLHCIFTSRALLHIRSLARNTQPTLSMMTGPLDIALADIKLIEVDSCLQKEEREKSTV